jgi:hypothetical protein
MLDGYAVITPRERRKTARYPSWVCRGKTGVATAQPPVYSQELPGREAWTARGADESRRGRAGKTARSGSGWTSLNAGFAFALGKSLLIT